MKVARYRIALGDVSLEHLEKLDAEAAARIAALLRVPLREAPYRAADAPVYLLTVRSQVLDADATLLLWTGLRRADIRLGDSSFVLKGIDAIELYPGVEVLFRRQNPAAYMFLSVGGRASLVT